MRTTQNGIVKFNDGKDFSGLVGKHVALSIELKQAMMFTSMP